MARILAIDYGQKRTGIAVTDELQIIASGLKTIPTETVFAFLKDYFSKEKVIKVLIGDPKQMNGQPSQSADMIHTFAIQFQNPLSSSSSHSDDIASARVSNSSSENRLSPSASSLIIHLNGPSSLSANTFKY